MKLSRSRLAAAGEILCHGRRVFSSFSDVLRYMVLCTSGPGSGPQTRKTSLAIRPLGNHRMACRPGTTDAAVLWHTFHGNFHLPDEPLPADCCILDLGANVGYTLAHFAALYPQGKVFGVEMDQGNYDLAIQNTSPFGSRCKLLHAAVSAADGMVRYGGERADGFHLLSGESSPDAGTRSVRSISMGSLIQELSLAKIDFLKMDIEGAEFDLFEGNLDWLQIVSAIKLEFHPPKDVRLIEQALERHGFRCTRDARHWSALTAKRA